MPFLNNNQSNTLCVYFNDWHFRHSNKDPYASNAKHFSRSIKVLLNKKCMQLKYEYFIENGGNSRDFVLETELYDENCFSHFIVLCALCARESN